MTLTTLTAKTEPTIISTGLWSTPAFLESLLVHALLGVSAALCTAHETRDRERVRRLAEERKTIERLLRQVRGR